MQEISKNPYTLFPQFMSASGCGNSLKRRPATLQRIDATRAYSRFRPAAVRQFTMVPAARPVAFGIAALI
jgi:hypothetical protein